ncbi:MAG: MBL fold metallo-hydrolase [Bacillota bacterium]|nr:MBL fold metallo-hydrolase [Bacillota bacterium]
MTVKFCSFASGSSGNCYLVKDEETAILIDAGISGKRIFEGLEQTDTPRDMVRAILVTHEHSDHVQSLPILSRKIPGLNVYANGATWDSIERPVAEEQQRVFVTGEDFYIGDFIVRPFPISHDAAEPVGFSLFHGETQISFCTDSGYISEDVFEEISRADLLLLEANHEKEMLLYGRYPYPLKQRILGDEGHLSNISCGECLCRMVAEHPKDRFVLLGHLSHENNTPDVAMQAIRNTLEEQQIFIGGQLQVDVVLRDRMSAVYEIG